MISGLFFENHNWNWIFIDDSLRCQKKFEVKLNHQILAMKSLITSTHLTIVWTHLKEKTRAFTVNTGLSLFYALGRAVSGWDEPNSPIHYSHWMGYRTVPCIHSYLSIPSDQSKYWCLLIIIQKSCTVTHLTPNYNNRIPSSSSSAAISRDLIKTKSLMP